MVVRGGFKSCAGNQSTDMEKRWVSEACTEGCTRVRMAYASAFAHSRSPSWTRKLSACPPGDVLWYRNFVAYRKSNSVCKLGLVTPKLTLKRGIGSAWMVMVDGGWWMVDGGWWMVMVMVMVMMI